MSPRPFDEEPVGLPREGGQTLYSVSIGVVALCSALVLQYGFGAGPIELFLLIGRLLATTLICVSVYQGWTTAKWVAVVLFGAAILESSVSYIAFFDRLPWDYNLALLTYVATLVCYVSLLLFSRHVRAFLEQRRILRVEKRENTPKKFPISKENGKHERA